MTSTATRPPTRPATAPPLRRVHPRTVAVDALLCAAVAAVSVAALATGDYHLSVSEVLRGIFIGSDDPFATVVLRDFRLPRVMGAILVGAALGVSGAILQALSGNPLGSPDIIGFTAGAATGALAEIILFDAGPQAIAAGALLGGFATAALMYLLAYRDGVSGYRLVLVGVGIAAMLQALNTWMIVRADLSDAQVGAQWLAGSLNGITWPQVAGLAVVVLVGVPLALAASPALSMLTLGDPVAIGLGVSAERTRRRLVLLSIVLVAAATAVTGPIAFVALAAPQIGRRLIRTGAVGIGTAAAMGALLVVAADLIAQRLLAPVQLPVGVVTGSLGGLYLIWLLSREWRVHRG